MPAISVIRSALLLTLLLGTHGCGSSANPPTSPATRSFANATALAEAYVKYHAGSLDELTGVPSRSGGWLFTVMTGLEVGAGHYFIHVSESGEITTHGGA